MPPARAHWIFGRARGAVLHNCAGDRAPVPLRFGLLVVSLSLAALWVVFPARGHAANGTLQGRVYAGSVGEESTPLVGVTVSLYGASNPYPDFGTFIRSTTTDSVGFYAFTVSDADGAFEYYHVVESDPAGYFSVGATSVGGTVRDSNWIEYVIPLTGKTLTGNKFWDQSVSVPTPTVTPVPLLSGRVYEGEVGDESRPLPEVAVSLYCAPAGPPELGGMIDSTVTDETGWYGLQIPAACRSRRNSWSATPS